MVLLTSSTVSVIISSGVVCTFTFLLFLSGYVLQQQTVRALQDALRQPPIPRPVPTLPAKFRHQENETVSVLVDEEGTDAAFQVGREDRDGEKIMMENPQSESDITYDLRLAYIFALTEPSDICSALLFTKQERSATKFRYKPDTILLYPTTWETVSKPVHTAVLTFMRQIQDQLDLIYHPVDIDPSLDLKSQLLGKLQWKRWDYDRAMYLRSPGYALDTGMLDVALSTSKLAKAWTPINSATGSNPDLMMYTPEKGLMSPRKEMRKLAVGVSGSHEHGHEEELEHRSAAKRAAYLVFEDAEMQARRDENSWFMDVYNRYAGERRSICAGTGLLPHESKMDQKRG